MYKKTFPLLMLASFALLIAPACGFRKKAKQEKAKKNDQTMTQVDIPVASEQVKSFFDDELNAFALADEESASAQALNSPDGISEYAWVEDENKKNADFKAIYFDFDRCGIKQTQQQNLAYDIQAVKKLVDEQVAVGHAHPDVKIIVEGHACHSAGSALYNLALSEKRAKIVSDRLVAAGVSREHIKIVGRGQEMPAMVNGKVVTGNREEQWPNRRAEFRILA